MGFEHLAGAQDRSKRQRSSSPFTQVRVSRTRLCTDASTFPARQGQTHRVRTRFRREPHATPHSDVAHSPPNPPASWWAPAGRRGCLPLHLRQCRASARPRMQELTALRCACRGQGQDAAALPPNLNPWQRLCNFASHGEISSARVPALRRLHDIRGIGKLSLLRFINRRRGPTALRCESACCWSRLATHDVGQNAM